MPFHKSMKDTHNDRNQSKIGNPINTGLDHHVTRAHSYEAIPLQMSSYRGLKWTAIEQTR